MAKATVFNDDQIHTLVILERTGGSLSLVSVVLIFIAYGLFDRLRTLPNTFIVFASVANVFASIASIIAYDGVLLGQTSALCQTQGFLFHMFVQSDPWWSLAMAINVLLVFFKGANPHTIKRWGWLYCLICYGGPFIIALVCLLLREPEKTVVYGSAGLWCWVSNDWNTLRIYTYYMLIWICILTSLVIYAGIGVYVFRARNKLRQLSGSENVRGTFEYPALNDGDNANRASTVSTCEWPLSQDCGGTTFGPRDINNQEIQAADNNQHTSTPSPYLQSGTPRPGNTHSPSLSPDPMRSPLPARYNTLNSPRPSPDSPAFMTSRRSSNPVRRLIYRFAVEDPVKRAYLRTAVLFALSVFVTWIPSSINRIRGLIYPDSPYPYNVATAAVLPLQGLWNGIIFFVTSWKNLRVSVRDMMTPGRGVVELTDRVEWRTGRRNGRGAGKVGYGDGGRLGPSNGGWDGEENGKGRDSWDFLDVGTEGADRGVQSRRDTPNDNGRRGLV